MVAKCPKCETALSSVRIQDVTIRADRNRTFKGVAYCCTSCSTAINVELDPLLLHQETVKAIKGR